MPVSALDKGRQPREVRSIDCPLTFNVMPTRLAVGLEPLNALGAACTIRPDSLREMIGSPVDVRPSEIIRLTKNYPVL
jgi:hypothetical protein